MATIKHGTINLESYTAKNGCGIKHIYGLGEGYKTKIKIEIYSDVYNFQSFARAEIWSPVSLTWNPIHSIHYSNMKTPSGLKTPSLKDFTADITSLLITCDAILEK